VISTAGQADGATLEETQEAPRNRNDSLKPTAKILVRCPAAASAKRTETKAREGLGLWLLRSPFFGVPVHGYLGTCYTPP
jgi:hypothetical protein